MLTNPLIGTGATGKLLATVGLPRSGKTTLCRDLYQPRGWTVVNPDNFRLAIHGQRYAAEAEPFVWACVHAAVDALLRSGNRVIVDATNLLIERRRPWLERGALFVVVDTPEQECVRRAEAAADAYIVPVIERMTRTAEPIQAWEPVGATYTWEEGKEGIHIPIPVCEYGKDSHEMA